MTTEELLPCPFCGGEPVSRYKTVLFRCGNSSCLIATVPFTADEWNRRAPPGVEGRGDVQERGPAPLTFFTQIACNMYAAAATRDDVSHYDAMRVALQAVDDARYKPPASTPPTDALAPQSGKKEDGWKCAARAQGTGDNDPAECDWPMCGCDPYADKVIASLQESGSLAVPENKNGD